MSTGVVKWFDTFAGYGFIMGLDGTEIYFYAASICEEGGGDNWSTGTRVEFDLIQTPVGPEATNVRCSAAYW